MPVADLLPGRLQATFWPGARVPADGHLALWGESDLPAAAAALGLPAGEPALLPTVLPRSPRARTRVVAADVPARVVPALVAARALAALPPAEDWPAWRRPADSVLAWSVAAKLACEFVAAGRVVPTLRAAGADIGVAAWRAAPAGDGRLAELAAVLPAAAHALRSDEDDDAVWSPGALLAAFCDAVADACARAVGSATPRSPAAPPKRSARRATGRAWPQRWAAALSGPDPLVDLSAVADAYDLAERLAGWAAPLARRDGQAVARLCLRLETPRDDGLAESLRDGAAPAAASEADAAAPAAASRGDAAGAAPAAASGSDAAGAAPAAASGSDAAGAAAGASQADAAAPAAASEDGLAGSPRDGATLAAASGGEAAGGAWPLRYLLQAADDPSLIVPAEQVWAQASGTLELLGRRVGDPQEALVRGLAEAARLFPPIDASLSEPRPAELDLKPAQAAAFLTEAAGALAAAGLGVLLPAELTADGARRLRARLRVGAGTPDPGKGIAAAGLDADGLADFRWELALGEDTLTAQEFEQIAALKQPLVRWRGRWIRVDPDQALRLADLAGTGGRLGGAEALAAALTGERDVAGLGAVEVVAEGGLAVLVDRLRAGDGQREPRLDGIRAELRDYQRRGVAWLQAMADLGLGTVLADDMGLGKTLQAIGLLAGRAGERPHLVVCPTSVVGNWERELGRFAPHLPVVRHHGPDRPDAPEGFPAGAVTVTSYGLVRRDADLLAGVEWDVVVVDEAQQVKNHAAQAARAVRRLPAAARVALTGTPVENRLSELWAILDFTNPGLLGPFGRFKEHYAIPVERWRDDRAAARLRRLVAPFLLRRVKTDPAVAADLPEKLEATVVCALTREQATLYQAAVDAAFAADDLGEGIQRSGRVLALLTALKQICNHPAQFLREAGPLARRSGKLARATEMLAEVVAAGDRALVFTQYRTMGELLARHLADNLRLPEVPFLHGGMPRVCRDALVAAFQDDDAAPPLLLVSLKAGGTGLNLTRATHVLHYDRWWNPAVEDQATDRAYRIGQTRTVSVHKLVTAGTVEERIAELLEHKRALADAVVGAGEAWLTELSDAELRDLVALSGDDVADEEPDE